MDQPIYLDYNATTPVDRRVFEEMAPYFCEVFGNAASSGHPYGSAAAEAVDKARAQVAKLIGASPNEIVFTSGATEADNIVIKGVTDRYARKGDHVITVDTEHKAILDSCAVLEEQGKRVTYLEVDKYGRIEAEDIAEAIDDETVLVSVMTANNETGVIQPIAEIGAVCREKGVLFHTDAVQAIGKIPFNVDANHVDLASLSAHKMYGPKGVGALYMRRRNPRAQATPLIDGGGHEDGMRSGTLNVAGIVGFGAAAELVTRELEEEMRRIGDLRRIFEEAIFSKIPEVKLNGHPEHRVPGTLNISFDGCVGDELLEAFTKIAVSSGAACTTAHIEPSHVLSAMGLHYSVAIAAIRFSLGRFTTADEVQSAIDHVAKTVGVMRSAA